MSVTIQITNNREYVRANCPELIEIETYDCNDEVRTIEYFPFELNMANGNFGDVFRSLGLALTEDEFWGGCIAPEKFAEALKNLKPKALVTDSIVDGNFYFQGRSLEQTTRYYWELNKICQEAMARGEQIVWG